MMDEFRKRKRRREDVRGGLDLNPGRGGLVDVELVGRGERGNNVLLQSELIVVNLCRIIAAYSFSTTRQGKEVTTHAFCLILLSMAERISSKMDLSKR